MLCTFCCACMAPHPERLHCAIETVRPLQSGDTCKFSSTNLTSSGISSHNKILSALQRALSALSLCVRKLISACSLASCCPSVLVLFTSRCSIKRHSALEPVSLCWCRIEGGYRAYHATVLSLLRQYPGSIVSANTQYRQQLCSHLCVAPPSSLSQPPASTTGADATAVQGANSTAVQPAAADAGIIAEGASEQPQQGARIAVAGVEFVAQRDMYLQCVAEPVGAAVASAEQTASDAARAVAKGKADAAAAVVKAAADAAAAAEAATSAAAVEAKPGKGGKDAKGGKPAAAAKPKDASSAADKGGKAGKGGKADKAAAAAADATAELPQPEFEFSFEGVKAPRKRSGAMLCCEDAVPESVIRHVLQILQRQFLEDMVMFCEEAESGCHSWAGEEEVAATEQLEARLRSHRYRQQ